MTRCYFILEANWKTAKDYGDLIINSKDGVPVYLRDLAQIKDSVEDERISSRFWFKGLPTPAATVTVAVFRQAGANAVEVAKRVRNLLPMINQELPASVKATITHDRSKTIASSIHDVQETLVIAFVLVVIVIFVFLGRAEDTLIPIVALPLSLLATFIVMHMLGYSLDNLSLMALTLAIGFLVDDAIIFLENTVRRLEAGEKVLEATINSAKEISFTILSMTMSLAAVFIPLVFMSGLMGRIFPRICDHHRGCHLGIWSDLVDAYAAHVRAVAQEQGRGGQNKHGWSVS